MDVLLIYPHASSSSVEEGIKVPPLGLGYIASVLEEREYSVDILDMNAQRELADHFEDILKEKRPRIVGITCLTPFYSTVVSLASKVKETLDAKVMVGGAHATALPEEVLRENCIDYVVLGEGEYTMLALSDYLLNDRGQPENIDGIAYIKDGSFYKTNPREYVANLDELFFPARHLLPNSKYNAPQYSGSRITSIITSRGCPYSCIFCDYRYLMGPKFRRRSPQNVVDEIEKCVNEYGIDYINFRDSTFTFNEKWISDFCELLKQRDLNIKWDCNGRVNLVTKEMLKEMRAAGCTLISYGIESGEQDILNFANKRITIEQSINAVKMTKEVGIEVLTYFIIGLPGENWETIQKTINLARKLNSDYTQFSLAIPFPGTPLRNYAKENNLIGEVNWDDYSLMRKAIMRTEELDFEELEKALKTAYKKFYLRPRYILKRACKLRPSNVKGNLQGFRMFIQQTRT